MNNEPVAYIPFAWYCAWFGDSDEPVWEQYEECHPATKAWDNFPDKIIPLYTHPAKTLTLTDDEVEEFEWVLKKHFNFPTNEIVPNLDKIIKAILRKAQEK